MFYMGRDLTRLESFVGGGSRRAERDNILKACVREGGSVGGSDDKRDSEIRETRSDEGDETNRSEE